MRKPSYPERAPNPLTGLLYYADCGSKLTHRQPAPDKGKTYDSALCKLTDDNEGGGLTFEIEKVRFCFRLTKPYSDERRRAASEYAKKHGMSISLHQL